MKLSGINALEEEMTPAPWRADGQSIDQLTDAGKGYPLNIYSDSITVYEWGQSQCGCAVTGAPLSGANSAGIVAIRNAWPAVIEMLEEARAVLLVCRGTSVTADVARNVVLARIDGEMGIK